MEANATIMPSKKKVIDPLPETFASEEAAGEFWDTHSLADYEEFLEPADLTFDLTNRIYEVRVSEDIFQKLETKAKIQHQSVPKTADAILRKELMAA